MSDRFHLLSEPFLQFGSEQEADDPHDGLAMFGPSESRSALPDHVAIGTAIGLRLWEGWVASLNSPAACEDVSRHRPWPPYPGYDVAFGCRWPSPIKEYALDEAILDEAARKADRFERAFAVANMYLEPIRNHVPKLDGKPAIAICIVPDDVYTNCRPKSYVADTSDGRRTKAEQMPFFHMRWAADYLDAENFLSTLLASYGPENHVGYNNPQYDALCRAADTTYDESKRQELYGQAEDLVLQEAPFVPVYFQRDAELINPRVKGLRESLFGHLPHTTVSTGG